MEAKGLQQEEQKRVSTTAKATQPVDHIVDDFSKRRRMPFQGRGIASVAPFKSTEHREVLEGNMLQAPKHYGSKEFYLVPLSLHLNPLEKARDLRIAKSIPGLKPAIEEVPVPCPTSQRPPVAVGAVEHVPGPMGLVGSGAEQDLTEDPRHLIHVLLVTAFFGEDFGDVGFAWLLATIKGVLQRESNNLIATLVADENVD